jgi:hypothetical protein
MTMTPLTYAVSFVFGQGFINHRQYTAILTWSQKLGWCLCRWTMHRLLEEWSSVIGLIYFVRIIMLSRSSRFLTKLASTHCYSCHCAQFWVHIVFSPLYAMDIVRSVSFLSPSLSSSFTVFSRLVFTDFCFFKSPFHIALSHFPTFHFLSFFCTFRSIPFSLKMAAFWVVAPCSHAEL